MWQTLSMNVRVGPPSILDTRRWPSQLTVQDLPRNNKFQSFNSFVEAILCETTYCALEEGSLPSVRSYPKFSSKKQLFMDWEIKTNQFCNLGLCFIANYKGHHSGQTDRISHLSSHKKISWWFVLEKHCNKEVYILFFYKVPPLFIYP